MGGYVFTGKQDKRGRGGWGHITFISKPNAIL